MDFASGLSCEIWISCSRDLNQSPANFRVLVTDQGGASRNLDSGKDLVDGTVLQFKLQAVALATPKLKFELYTPDSGCSEFDLQVVAHADHTPEFKLKASDKRRRLPLNARLNSRAR